MKWNQDVTSFIFHGKTMHMCNLGFVSLYVWTICSEKNELHNPVTVCMVFSFGILTV